MTPDILFQLAGRVAMLGWLLLAIGLFLPRRWSAGCLLLGGRVVPLLLSSAYAACLLRWWGGSEGGFASLDALAQLFGVRGLLLAGWIHYLAFDLLVGRWQVDQTQAAGSPPLLRWFTVPCLAATLMFGPAGLLLYLLLQAATRRLVRPMAVAA